MTGTYNAKMDEKNRLFVPAKLRQELGDSFYVTVGINGDFRCLTVYKDESWAGITRRYEELPISKRGGASSLLFSFATQCVPDKQFRFSLTQSQMKYAGITREVVITGRAGQAEIWDAERYAEFEAAMLTPQNLLTCLEEIGL